MTDWQTKPCRDCGEPMIWTTTSRGKKMPIDAEPRPGGKFTLSGEVGDPQAQYVSDASGRDLYGPHFETCPHADRFRK